MLVVAQSERLGKLIRLLASDVPGEVLATVAAIKRITDLHALADFVERNFAVDNRNDLPPPGAGAAPAMPWWQAMAVALLHHDPPLIWGGREAEFLRNVIRKRHEPSPGQVKWLKDIADRANNRRRAA